MVSNCSNNLFPCWVRRSPLSGWLTNLTPDLDVVSNYRFFFVLWSLSSEHNKRAHRGLQTPTFFFIVKIFLLTIRDFLCGKSQHPILRCKNLPASSSGVHRWSYTEHGWLFHKLPFHSGIWHCRPVHHYDTPQLCKLVFDPLRPYPLLVHSLCTDVLMSSDCMWLVPSIFPTFLVCWFAHCLPHCSGKESTVE